MSDDTYPLGPEIQEGSATLNDGIRTITIGRLYPFPIYLVEVKSALGKHTRFFIGWRKAAGYANEVWGGE